MFRCLFVLLCAAGAIAQQWEAGCGASKYADAGTHPQVIGGREARVNELPWQVSLNSGDPSSHFCGAVVVNANWIVTAAHCVDGRTEDDVGASVGEHDSNADLPSRVQVSFSQIIVHPEYDPSRSNNDIALMQTTQPMQLNENVRGACRAAQPFDFYLGKKVTISGWGNTFSGFPSSPDALQLTQVTVASNERCELDYPGSITDAMVCAGTADGTGRDTCQGDSGGPMVYNNNGKFELIGLVSWGRGCADGYLGVYTRVHKFNQWIDGIVG